MILERKGSNIATLMAWLELEVDQYFVDLSCVHIEGIEHCMPAKHGTNIETKLQGFEILRINQHILLKHYLRNRPHKAHWNMMELHRQCITLKSNCSMDIVQVEIWIICRTMFEIEI